MSRAALIVLWWFYRKRRSVGKCTYGNRAASAASRQWRWRLQRGRGATLPVRRAYQHGGHELSDYSDHRTTILGEEHSDERTSESRRKVLMRVNLQMSPAQSRETLLMLGCRLRLPQCSMQS